MNAHHITDDTEDRRAAAGRARLGRRHRRWTTMGVLAVGAAVVGYVLWRRLFFDRNPYVAPLTLSSMAFPGWRAWVGVDSVNTLDPSDRFDRFDRFDRAAPRSRRRRIVLGALVAGGLVASTMGGPAEAAAVRAGTTCKRQSIGETSIATNGATLMCAMQNGKPVYRSCPKPSTRPTTPEGDWTNGPCSVAGYRVFELFAGKPSKNPAVGRTDKITATMAIVGAANGWVVRDIKVTVDMASLTSQEERRDATLSRRGLETTKFPSASFVGTGDIALPASAASGSETSITATGTLTLHGVARELTIPVKAQFKDGQIRLLLSTTIRLADYQIEPPSVAGFVTVDSTGTIEALLVMSKA